MNICFLTSIRAFVLIVVINVILPWTLNQMSKSTSIIRTMWRWSQKDTSFEKEAKQKCILVFAYILVLHFSGKYLIFQYLLIYE